MRKFLLLLSHIAAVALGFGLGIYALPILIAPSPPTPSDIGAQASKGQGTVSVGPGSIGLAGELSPGPDYKLYLSPEFVETEADFNRLKPRMVRVADIKTFRSHA